MGVDVCRTNNIYMMTKFNVGFNTRSFASAPMICHQQASTAALAHQIRNIILSSPVTPSYGTIQYHSASSSDDGLFNGKVAIF
jgi:hypothetical protein